ncbi:putative YbeD-like domain superfamily protein [Helianthus debilis subsp. tardiflorus]
MACCRVLPFRTLMLTELRRVSSKATPFPFPFSLSFVVNQISTTTPPRCRITRRMHRFNCSHHDENLSSTDDDGDQEPPQEAVLKVISEVSKTEGRVGQTTNMVLGGTVTDDSSDEWLTLDQKVNTYPTVRGFTAIGTGGDDFVQAMVIAVESVVQHPIPQGNVKQKMSSGGKYVSVNIGPVQVVSSEQVQAVYNAMRRDVRMKYFL